MKISLTGAIVIAMVVGGLIGFGIAEGAVSKETGAALLTTFDVLSKIFLKLIKTIVSPLIFSTLVVGIAGHSNLKQVGRMGLKAIIYFEVITTIALFIGLGAINFTKAGVGVSKPDATETLAKPPRRARPTSFCMCFPTTSRSRWRRDRSCRWSSSVCSSAWVSPWWRTGTSRSCFP